MLEIGDLAAADGDFIGEFQARAFERAVRFARQFEVDAQFFGVRFERGCLFLDPVEFGAQRLVGRARLVEHAGEAQRLRLFLLERAQRAVERRDDLFEGFLELVEFADLAAGIAQQITQRLVFLAHARTDVGKILDDVVAPLPLPRPALISPLFRPNKFDNFAITRPPTQRHVYTLLRYYISMPIETYG